MVSWSVFVNPLGAASVKSLIVRLVDGVEELIVTVLETVLVMKIPVWLTVDGGVPNDQLFASCQKPAAVLLVQVFGDDAAEALSAKPI